MIKVSLVRRTMMALMVAIGGIVVHSHANPAGQAETVDSKKGDEVYFVPEYDPKRDPAKDLEKAVKLAQEQHKNIILQVGNSRCKWCSRITKFFHVDPAVREVLSKEYVLMKVNCNDENTNEKFLSSYPEFDAFPHLFILDDNGKLLHSHSTDDLEEGDSYSEQKMLAFLNQWTPEKVSAAKSDPE